MNKNLTLPIYHVSPVANLTVLKPGQPAREYSENNNGTLLFFSTSLFPHSTVSEPAYAENWFVYKAKVPIEKLLGGYMWNDIATNTVTPVQCLGRVKDVISRFQLPNPSEWEEDAWGDGSLSRYYESQSYRLCEEVDADGYSTGIYSEVPVKFMEELGLPPYDSDS